MIFKRGFGWIILRVVFLTALLLGVTYSIFATELFVTPIMFGLCIIISITELLFFLNRRERHWAQFLLSVEHQDFNRSYKNQTSSKELQEAYELITKSFEELQTERVADYRLLQTLLGHVSIGLICYHPNGAVYFTNKSFNELTNKIDVQQLSTIKEALPNIYHALLDESMIAQVIEHGRQKLYLKKESFKLKGNDYRLASLADIQNPLESNELESYQKLMRVMTHEIMNSATPILSLIQVINKKLVNKNELNVLQQKDQANVAKSLEVIEEQTKGILKFVESYRQINKPIELNRSTFSLNELIEQAITFIQPPSSVQVTFNQAATIDINADKGLLNQVFINLMKNAIEALEKQGEGEIAIELTSSSQLVKVTISDSGPGIPVEELDKIFVPFYTTKKEGSGIGLALSRKIIKAHNGKITHQANVEGKNAFVIEMPIDN